ncbi:MAG: prohibitin family protein [candidate division Zixibacteria bacterium]|nr:prohibitin family protein [candidate division Zixibacteria bacterium]
MKMTQTNSNPARRLRMSRALPLLFIALFAVGCGTKIPSGHRGVIYRPFAGGTELGNVYQEGFVWHFPWNSFFVYRTQLQERKEALEVLSADGANIRIDLSLLFRVDPTRIDSLQVSIGPNYYNDAIAPNLRGEVRSIIGQYKPEEIYSSKRDQIAKDIADRLRITLVPKFILVENVIVRDVTLPKRITAAINAKLEASQEAEKMEFVILREKQEAERKRIEAKGIADFQRIVSVGLNELLLRWKGIEATQALAESPNAKMVVIGSGKDGMPLILGGAQ